MTMFKFAWTIREIIALLHVVRERPLFSTREPAPPRAESTSTCPEALTRALIRGFPITSILGTEATATQVMGTNPISTTAIGEAEVIPVILPQDHTALELAIPAMVSILSHKTSQTRLMTTPLVPEGIPTEI